MSKVKITVGGDLEKEATRNFIDAWHRAERGRKFSEHRLSFESWDALARVLTGKRVELLRYVRQHDVKSVRALAKALARDYSNVHADVQALTEVGLLETTGDGVRADYDAIETKIAIKENHMNWFRVLISESQVAELSANALINKWLTELRSEGLPQGAKVLHSKGQNGGRAFLFNPQAAPAASRVVQASRANRTEREFKGEWCPEPEDITNFSELRY